ncbi:putative ribonuclease H-like domain-containing protein [Tanacetum coccineum]
MALMAFSDSEVYTDKSCSKYCLKNYESLKKQCDDLLVRLNETEFKAATYKRGCNEISVIKTEYEKVKQEKEGIDFKIAKFDKSAKDLDEMLGSQITNKSKKGLGYNVPEFNGYGPRDTELKTTIDCDKESDNSKENTDESLETEQVTNNESSSVESPLKFDKETVIDWKEIFFHPAEKAESVKPKNNEKLVKKTVRYAEMYRSQSPRGNQIWNGQKSNQLGSEFVMYNKACYGCGSFDHIQINFPNHQRKSRVTGQMGSMILNPQHVGFGDLPDLMVHHLFSTDVTTLMHKMNDKGFFDSGCLRHMTGNIAYLTNFKEYNGGYVTFGGGAYGGRITGKDMKNIVPKESLTCLVAKATSDESMLWHRRLGHINFKNINKLVKENLIRGLPLKCFENDQTCVACLKGKQHRASSRTPQQNRVAERRNRTLTEAARTMLADSKLPTTFWVEAVSTACYVQNRVLIVKPHNKTPYELFRGIKPALSFMKPFGCHVTILNTLDSLGKFDGKSDKGFFAGYSLSSKAFRVYNTRTKKVEENLHIGFLENKLIIEGNGPKWLFDIDSLTQFMNYVPVTTSTSTNESAGSQEDQNAGTFVEKDRTSQDCIVMPIWKDALYFDSPSKQMGNDDSKSVSNDPKENEDGSNDESNGKEKSEDDSSTKQDNTANQPVNTASPRLNTSGIGLYIVGSSVNTTTPEDMVGSSHSLEATHDEFFNDKDEPNVDLGNIPNSYAVPTTPHTRIHINHPFTNVIGNIQSSAQTRRMKEPVPEQGFLSAVYKAKTHEDLHTCLFAYFLSQEEPKRISQALSDPAWVEVMQEELLQNKKDEKGIVIRNKTRLIAQGHTQEEGIDYDEVIAPVVRIVAIRLFLAYASFMGFMVYQIDVKSAFLYGQIEEEVYVCQPPGFEDPDYPDKVYRVIKALFHRGKIDQALFIKKKKGDILLVQICVDDIIFGFTKKELCTEFEKLMKDKF